MLLLNFNLRNSYFWRIYINLSCLYFDISKICCSKSCLLHWLFLNNWEMILLLSFYFKFWSYAYALTSASFIWVLLNIMIFLLLFHYYFLSIYIAFGVHSLTFFKQIRFKYWPIARLLRFFLLLYLGWDLICW